MVVAGAGLFAQSAILTKAGGTDFAAATFYRCVYALPVLAAWSYFGARFGTVDARISGRGIIAGLLFGGNLLCWNAAIGLIGASLAAVLGNVQVVIVALAVWILGGRRPHSVFWLACVLACCGTALIAGWFTMDGQALAGSSMRGTLLCLGSAVCGAFCLLVLAALPKGSKGQVPVLRDMTCTAMLLALVWSLIAGPASLAIPAQSHLVLLVLALSSQVIAWYLYNRGLLGVTPVMAAGVSLGQPVLTIATAWFVLGEQLAVTEMLGCLMILSAIAGMSWAGTRMPRVETQEPGSRVPPTALTVSPARRPGPHSRDVPSGP